MMYYNDLPRFMEALSDGHIQQNSCLHGGASLKSILVSGNGMYKIWQTGSARIEEQDGSIHDFGACTVAQLLFGYDESLDEQVQYFADYDGDSEYGDDYFSYYDGSNPCLASYTYYDYLESIYSAQGPPTYDFVVLNDNTRSPARYPSRKLSLEVLQDVYAPWFIETGVTPVFLFTYGKFEVCCISAHFAKESISSYNVFLLQCIKKRRVLDSLSRHGRAG